MPIRTFATPSVVPPVAYNTRARVYYIARRCYDWIYLSTNKSSPSTRDYELGLENLPCFPQR